MTVPVKTRGACALYILVRDVSWLNNFTAVWALRLRPVRHSWFFWEILRAAVSARDNPREILQDIVDAQQADQTKLALRSCFVQREYRGPLVLTEGADFERGVRLRR